MQIINLKKYYYPYYTEDVFVEVSDEVAEVMRLSVREMKNYERRTRYHRAFYSLAAYSWMENYALEHGISPEEILLQAEEQTAREKLASDLSEALCHTTPTQARRVYDYYITGISQREIARREGVHNSKVCVAIQRGLKNMRRYYEARNLTE